MQTISRSRRCLALLLLWLVSTISHAGEIEPIDDLFVGVWTPFAVRWEKTVPVCIWSYRDETQYRVVANGLQSGNRFLLSNEVGDSIPYNVFWETGQNFKQRERLYPNRPSKRSYLYAQNEKCAGKANFQLRVRINKKKLNSAPAAIYQDSFLLMLSPL